MIRFMHLADIHLDTPFKGLKQSHPHLQQKLVEASKDALYRAVSIAIKQALDFVIIVGDVYDASKYSVSARHFFYQQLERLEAANIPLILCHGNHDFISPDHAMPSYPTNVHVFPSESVTSYELNTRQGEKVTFNGFSYRSKWIKEDKVAQYPPKSQTSTYTIGLLHGQVTTSGQDNAYAPFTIQALEEKAYDYWALGHVHAGSRMGSRGNIIYPGSLQGKSSKETGDKGAYVVSLGQGDGMTIDFISLAPFRWEAASIQCQRDWDEIQLVKEVQTVLNNYDQESVGTNQIYLVKIVLSDFQVLSPDLQDKLMDGQVYDYIQEQASPEGQAYLVDFAYEIGAIKDTFAYDQILDQSYRASFKNLQESDKLKQVLDLSNSSGTMKALVDQVIQDEEGKKALFDQASLLINQRLGLQEEVSNEN